MGFQYIVKWIFTLFIISAVAACSSDSGDDGSTSRDIEQPPSIQEGHSDTQTLTLTLVSPVSGALSYETFNITAAEKSDYVAIQGNITVEEGAEYDFDVTVYGDTQIEADEMFGLRFTDASGAEVSTLMGTITNDDFPNVSVSSPEVTELDVGTSRLRFEFILTDYVVDDYTLNVSSLTDEQLAQIDREQYPYVATPDVDFEAVNQEIVFKAGELTKTLEVIVSSDDIIEGDEIVFLNVTSDDIDVLSEPYAKGVIRTDETPKVNGNGFDFTYADDSPKLSLMTEGTTDDDSQRNWKAINIAFDIKQPENIKQAQMVALSILSEEEYEKVVPNSDVSYVSTQGKDADICLNLETDLSLDDTPCQTEQVVTIEPGDKRVEFTLFIQQDTRLETDETFMLALSNDQNVRFLDVQGIPGQIINDDSEELYVAVEGELDEVALNAFREKGGELSVNEPKGNGATTEYTLNFNIKTQLEEPFPVEYEIVTYFVKEGASISEFEEAEGEMVFDAETSSHDIPLIVKGDGDYDGDKYIQVRFANDSIQPLIVRIIDSNPPEVSIKPTGQPSANLENDVYVEDDVYALSEQEENSYDNSNSGTRDYAFNLELAQPRIAITDLTYKLVLEPYSEGFRAQSLEGCQNLSKSASERLSTATTDPANTSERDVTLYVNGSSTPSNTITIEKGTTQVGWTLKVKNDSLIECAEYFKVGFIPEVEEGSAEQTGTSAIFKIDNKDGVKVSLDGFDVTEGVDGVATLNANKPIAASLALAVEGDTHNCSSDDIGDIGDFASAVAITPSQLSNIATSIPTQNDNLVEPTEDCKLTVSAENDTHAAFPVQYEYNQTYCQETQGCDYAVGRIRDNDKLVIEMSVTNSDFEPNKNGEVLESGTEIPFTYSTKKPVAPNVPLIKLGLSHIDTCSQEEVCATYDDDFSFVSEVEIHKGDGTYTPAISVADKKPLGVTITPDEIVELDEKVKIEVTSSSSYISTLNGSDSGSTKINYTIENDDTSDLSFSHSGNLEIDEGSTKSRPLFLSWTNSVSDDIAPLCIELDASGLATLNADYQFSGIGSVSGSCTASNGNVVFAIDDMSSRNGAKEIQIEVKGDPDVEYDERITLEASLKSVSSSLATPVSDYLAFSADNEPIEFIIKNDDFINYEFVKDDGLSKTQLSQDSNIYESYNVLLKIDAYKADGIDASDRELSFNFEAASQSPVVDSADVAINNASFQLQAGDVAEQYIQLANIVVDEKIEKDENFKIDVTHTDKNLYSSTSAGNQWQVISTEKFTVKSNSDSILEGASGESNTHVIEVCAKYEGTDYFVQDYSTDGSDGFTLNVAGVNNGDALNQSEDYTVTYYKAETGSDYTFENPVVGINEFTSKGDCKSYGIVKTVGNNKVNPNKHLEFEVASNDSRLLSAPLHDYLVIVNDDYSSVTDTGLTNCMNKSDFGDETDRGRRIVDCSLDYIIEDFVKQDAVMTDAARLIDLDESNNSQESDWGDHHSRYATLSYTEINAGGQLMTGPSDNGLGQASYPEGECFHDNSTGLLWVTSDVSISDSDSKCGVIGWKRPSLQQLTSLQIFEQMKVDDGGKPVPNIRRSNKYAEHDGITVAGETLKSYFKSAYRTSTSCIDEGFDGGGQGIWTLDFFNGITRCEPNSNLTEANGVYNIYVYQAP